MATTGTKTPPLEDDLTIVAAAPTTTLTMKKKSKFGAAAIMRAAMYMIGLGSSRRNNNKKGNEGSSTKESTTTTTNSTLKLVGSVRPIYGSECVPENSPPHDNQVMTKPHDENSEIQQVPPSSNGNEEGMLSAVSSAYWLVNEDGTPEMLYPPPANEDAEKDAEKVEMNRDDNDDTYYDGIQGDDSIDAKAEVFISQFYQQMRNQGLTPVDRG